MTPYDQMILEASHVNEQCKPRHLPVQLGYKKVKKKVKSKTTPLPLHRSAALRWKNGLNHSSRYPPRRIAISLVPRIDALDIKGVSF
jgi:hypothetical protein